MPNGKHHDSPLTDMMVRGTHPFPPDIEESLRKIDSLITLTDLTFAGTALITTTGRPGQVWGLVLVLYFCMATPISWLVRRFETALARRQRGQG